MKKTSEYEEELANDRILIDVVTICKNNPQEVLKTLRSVDSLHRLFNRDAVGFTLKSVIIDGSMNNDCFNVISKNSWCMETCYAKQNSIGIYQAMNESLKFLNGDWVWFLNSGDYWSGIFSSDSFEILKDRSLSAIYFDLIISTSLLSFVKKNPDEKQLFDNQGRFNFPSHQSIFYNIKNIGSVRYDVTQGNHGDKVFSLPFFRNSVRKVNVPIAIFNIGGASNAVVKFSEIVASKDPNRKKVSLVIKNVFKVIFGLNIYFSIRLLLVVGNYSLYRGKKSCI